MYPEDVKREGEHPAPFPGSWSARLLRLYRLWRGSAAFRARSCSILLPAPAPPARWRKAWAAAIFGIEINAAYARMAEARVHEAPARAPLLLVGRPKYPGKQELKEIAAAQAGSTGKLASSKQSGKPMGGKCPARTARS